MKDLIDFARNHPFEFIGEAITAFAIIWGGAFAIALAG